MIDFTTQQLSWFVISVATIGGGGYVTLNQKVDDISTKVAVGMANEDNMAKQLAQLQLQLNRIEDKIDTQNLKRNK
jgi:hypothetical protein